MKAGIICIGDELLIGQTINTNAAWLGKTLGDAGITVQLSSTIEDNKHAIVSTLEEHLQQFKLVIITGGLGPTNDDITKETLTDYFNTSLELDEEALQNIKHLLGNRGIKMLEANVQQAYLPKDALHLKNENGTASGMWFERNNKIVISLPGVPYEMKTIISKEVLPLLKKKFKLQGRYYKTVMIQGIGESTLANKIRDWEQRAKKDQLHLAYLPSPGIIKLRLNSERGQADEALIDAYFNELKEKYPQYVYATEDCSIFEAVSNLLKSKKYTLGTVESCTGGNIARSFVEIPGASEFFKGGLITYSNELKINLAHVSPQTLNEYGAVSENVAQEMAQEGRKVLQTDYTIAVTGIAGPDGGSEEKPVGTVWIAIDGPSGTIAKMYNMGQHRGRNIEKSGSYALNLLRKVLLGIKMTD